MSELKINKESFDDAISELNDVLDELEIYNRDFFVSLVDEISNCKSEFIKEYKNSINLTKKEWDESLVKSVRDLTSNCTGIISTFDNVDITISEVVKNGGSF